MRIAFYAPFKPLDHPNPSGDLMIGRTIYSFLQKRGHRMVPISRLRSRWIYWKPGRLLQALFERQKVAARLKSDPVDLWLTYHCYYKAPDLLGPRVCAERKIPYAIIQPSYGTRVSRSWKTRPGFLLNRQALLTADVLITDRKRDYINLQRIVPPGRLQRFNSGLDPGLFSFSAVDRRKLRSDWQIDRKPVILAAAMFRSDVKTRSLTLLLKSCARLHELGHDFLLVLVGDGPEKNRLMELARALPDKKVLFAGRIARQEMAAYYSAADIFAFPGINEALGMVFLEAQSCGLPVVAMNNGGIPEVVEHGSTGLLTPLADKNAFNHALIRLLHDTELRRRMGKAAAAHVRRNHDISNNYKELEQILIKTIHDRQQS